MVRVIYPRGLVTALCQGQAGILLFGFGIFRIEIRSASPRGFPYSCHVMSCHAMQASTSVVFWTYLFVETRLVDHAVPYIKRHPMPTRSKLPASTIPGYTEACIHEDYSALTSQTAPRCSPLPCSCCRCCRSGWLPGSRRCSWHRSTSGASGRRSRAPSRASAPG